MRVVYESETLPPDVALGVIAGVAVALAAGVAVNAWAARRGARPRARRHQREAVIAGGLLVATQLSLLGYHGRAAGHTELSAVIRIGDDVERSRRGRVLAGPIEVARGVREVSGDDHAALAPGDIVVVRVGSPNNWALGARPTIGWWHGLALCAVALGFWIAYGRRRRARAR